ncbi:hypothetical protein HK100_011896 [Physocladia obscura]|uniref:Uncharacterized protein n=1 Tax=Physocladia obscura TaxID=109957 RepID=A0AAD5XHZ9_9FUNG|nr:hypothetical protein HK100_011896 [Physocladia obscura]
MKRLLALIFFGSVSVLILSSYVLLSGERRINEHESTLNADDVVGNDAIGVGEGRGSTKKIPLTYNASTSLNAVEIARQQELRRLVEAEVTHLLEEALHSETKEDGLTGLTFLGSDAQVSSALLVVQRLRSLGCALPAEFAHFEHESLTPTARTQLASANITARAFTIKNSGNLNYARLGSGKPSAILSSPFMKVVFLDPDMFPLQNPEFLLHSKHFTTTGALFWPDYRPATADRKVWALMRFSKADFDREWDSGLCVVNKSRTVVRAALKIAEFMCANANFYFSYFWGDKEAFHWAFKLVGREILRRQEASHKSISGKNNVNDGVYGDDGDENSGRGVYYWINQHQPHSLGILEPSKQSASDSLQDHKTQSLNLSQYSPVVIPATQQFCGQNFLHFDLTGKVPLFIHMTRLKKYNQRKEYHNVIEWPFHLAQLYVAPIDKTELEFGNTGCVHISGFLAEQCCQLENVEGLNIVTYEKQLIDHHYVKNLLRVCITSRRIGLGRISSNYFFLGGFSKTINSLMSKTRIGQQKHSADGARLAQIVRDSRAHVWNDTIVTVAPCGSAFADQFGRTLHLRLVSGRSGVNVCGHSKLPTTAGEIDTTSDADSESDAATANNNTHNITNTNINTNAFSTHAQPTPTFFHHRDVSFVGRPFPLADADEHFARLKSWGLTFVRLLVTWEALEHKGPGIYDEDFISYLNAILAKAHEHGIKCFIDPHQDTWSRFSGGSGAPGWTFEISGLDIKTFEKIGAAHLHNFNPATKNSHQYWPTNYAKLACATMFTLFFAGHILAPRSTYNGINIGTFLQDRYIACYAHLASRIKHCKAVIGFEFMNEPHYGYIGVKDLNSFDKNQYLHFGKFPSPLQSFALGAGLSVDVDVWVNSWPNPSRKAGMEVMNSEKVSGWLDYGECIWKKHGVWGVNEETGSPEIRKPNYFTSHPETGTALDFYTDFYMPLFRRYTSAIQSVNPDYFGFLEPIPNEDPPILSASDRLHANLVYAPHWYDLRALWTKSFDPTVTFDVQSLVRGTKNILTAMYIGMNGAERNYTQQMRTIAATGLAKVGARPVVMGEVGIPMDINEKKAYETGNYTQHTVFLDTVINSMEANMFNFTLWNYNPGNDNTHGDHWNGEDFSIFSPNAINCPSPRGIPRRRDYSTPSDISDSDTADTHEQDMKQNISFDSTTRIAAAKKLPKLETKPYDEQHHQKRASILSLDHIPVSPFEITEYTFLDAPLEGDPDHHHHRGGRALDAAIRPYAAKIAGTPVSSRFNLSKLIYTLEFTTKTTVALDDKQEGTIDSPSLRYITEIFIPNFHFKFENIEIEVQVSDGEWLYDQERQTLYWHHDPSFRNNNSSDAASDANVLHKIIVKAPDEEKGVRESLWRFAKAFVADVAGSRK